MVWDVSERDVRRWGAELKRLCEQMAPRFGRVEVQKRAPLIEYEVRSWIGWYRHITLSMLALAMLVAIRAQARTSSRRKKSLAGLRPLTGPEVRTVLVTRFLQRAVFPEAVLAFSQW